MKLYSSLTLISYLGWWKPHLSIPQGFPWFYLYCNPGTHFYGCASIMSSHKTTSLLSFYMPISQFLTTDTLLPAPSALLPSYSHYSIPQSPPSLPRVGLDSLSCQSITLTARSHARNLLPSSGFSLCFPLNNSNFLQNHWAVLEKTITLCILFLLQIHGPQPEGGSQCSSIIHRASVDTFLSQWWWHPQDCLYSPVSLHSYQLKYFSLTGRTKAIEYICSQLTS